MRAIHFLACFKEKRKKITKKESSRQVCFCLIAYFGMNKAILCVYVFLSMHVLNFMF